MTLIEPFGLVAEFLTTASFILQALKTIQTQDTYRPSALFRRTPNC
jgi:uncharacterized protein with PQ loop repeat